MGGARFVGHADFVMLIGRRYKIDEGGVKIDIVRNQNSIWFQLLPKILKLEVLVFVAMGAIMQKEIDLIGKSILLHELLYVSDHWMKSGP